MMLVLSQFRLGEKFSLQKHSQGTEIKAITYSNMQIHQKDSRVDVFVIVDIWYLTSNCINSIQQTQEGMMASNFIYKNKNLCEEPNENNKIKERAKEGKKESKHENTNIHSTNKQANNKNT